MTSKKLIALRTASLLTLMAALPLGGQAWQGRAHPGSSPGGQGPDMMGVGAPPILRLVRELDMSEVQREQVFTVLDRYQPSLRKLMFSLGDGREALQAVLSEGGFDPARLEQDAAAHGRAAQELYVTTARMLSEISALLTPAQRVRLDESRQFAGPTPR